MSIFYFMFEGKPLLSNPESQEFEGAYICCWVKSDNENLALSSAKAYIEDEGWEIVCIEEKFVAKREEYIDNQESLDAFDQAINYGVGAVFYTWPSDLPN